MEPIFINKLKHSKEIYIEKNKAFSKISRFAVTFIFHAAYLSLALIFSFDIMKQSLLSFLQQSA